MIPASSSDKIFISVIIPTRNREKLLVDTLTCLQAQDYPADSFEIIVVDDGSTDDTKQIVDRMQTKPAPALRYVYQSPSRINAARNNGLQHAQGSFIIFTDDDVEVRPDFLAAYAAAAARYPEALAFGGPVHPRFEGKPLPPRVCGHCGTLEDLENFDRGLVDVDVPRVIGANMAMRREAFERFNSFNNDFSGRGDETEWHWRLGQAGLAVRYIARAHVWHRRLPEDKWTMVKRMFKKKKGYVWFVLQTTGPIPSVRTACAKAIKWSWHAVRSRCFRAVLLTAWHVGTIAGWFQWVLPRSFSRAGQPKSP